MPLPSEIIEIINQTTLVNNVQTQHVLEQLHAKKFDLKPLLQIFAQLKLQPEILQEVFPPHLRCMFDSDMNYNATDLISEDNLQRLQIINDTIAFYQEIGISLRKRTFLCCGISKKVRDLIRTIHGNGLLTQNLFDQMSQIIQSTDSALEQSMFDQFSTVSYVILQSPQLRNQDNLLALLNTHGDANNWSYYCTIIATLNTHHLLTQDRFNFLYQGLYKKIEEAARSDTIINPVTTSAFSSELGSDPSTTVSMTRRGHAIHGHYPVMSLDNAIQKILADNFSAEDKQFYIESLFKNSMAAVFYHSFHQAGILTRDNIMLLAKPEHAWLFTKEGAEIRYVWSYIRAEQTLLNQLLKFDCDNKQAAVDFVYNIANKPVVEAWLGHLNSAHNVNQLMHPRNKWFVDGIVYWAHDENREWREVLDWIPHHVITQTRLDELLAGGQKNAETYLQGIYQEFRVQQVLQPHQAPINHSHSTHTASVHQTVSESATKLLTLYNPQKDQNKRDEVFQEIQRAISRLPEQLTGSDKTQLKTVVERCVSRISQSMFVDYASKIMLPDLLALTWRAIHDDKKRIGTVEDAEKCFFTGLYDIQRGYNLSDLNVDDSEHDSPICESGAFNKLVNALQGVHPDCDIQVITTAMASLKLRRVVIEAAQKYLSHLKDDSDSRLPQLIATIKAQGNISTIYNPIKPSVFELMFDEFGSAFSGKKDGPFAELINGGKDVALPDNFLEKILSDSDDGVTRQLTELELAALKQALCKIFEDGSSASATPAFFDNAASPISVLNAIKQSENMNRIHSIIRTQKQWLENNNKVEGAYYINICTAFGVIKKYSRKPDADAPRSVIQR